MLDVVVIGAGQAGLSAAYHLRRRGLVPGTDFVVLDSNDGPGGAWRHRWPSLTLGAAHGIHDLPGLALGTPDPTEPASSVVARYYGTYEDTFDLQVRRPVTVREVRDARPEEYDGLADVAEPGPRGTPGVGAPALPDAAEQPPLVVVGDDEVWVTRTIINATGTWTRPYWPHYPGRELFRGRQLHTHDFWSVEEFRGQHVVVVGGGASAVQFLLPLAEVATTTWATRRPPVFGERDFDREWGIDVERRVKERTSAGLPTLSVVEATGLPLTPEYQRGIDDGVLVSRGMFTGITADGVVFPAAGTPGTAGEPAQETEIKADAILWATGFRPAVDHLSPLRLREHGGAIATDGVHVPRDPRVYLAGYGSGASTIGATRSGRAAAVAAARAVGDRTAAPTS
ncbi:Predicted flavoprotein CzcO associated with the cation diffusion facilitator CzcD [Sanguibacter gelidistatuariae]|uniref:Predicted flavoprotein CzcO associated with the cation diffusion facilitator CzcD n=1 Tax=Sanguibacter gelidistatuariae TaxID=1814289 RepID=A0A1G6HDQ6_9MICO|nr:FAD-dependent oxidoreductase [Sanguibacter gelidistatuariae]SDB92447.1 Predicted flavoprotein CzcO associated with the cation diffusion facilitator CzcD [Sanguibacter gelidistatuariae]